MGVKGPVPIPFPKSSFPGYDSQESEGRLVNCYIEPLGENDQKKQKWIRSAGLSLFTTTALSGYRGGLAVGNLSYDCWANNASTVNSAGAVSSIGTFPGTGKISIARNQAQPNPDVVAVDLVNGAYVLGSSTLTPATAQVTIVGSNFNAGGTVTLVLTNPLLSAINPAGFPVSITYTIKPSDTPTLIAAGLVALINANSVLSAANLTATNAGPVITISHQGSAGNSTTVLGTVNNAVFMTATNLGTSSSSSGATATLTGVTAPANSLIVVCIAENDTGAGTVSDSVNGSYTYLDSQQQSFGPVNLNIYYFANSAALSSAVITYTKKTSGSVTVLSAFYVTGANALAPFDPNVSASSTAYSAFSSTLSPTVTSGTPNSPYEMMIGVLGWFAQNAPTYNQVSGFSTPPNLAGPTAVTSGVMALEGGVLINPTKTAVTFNPTLTYGSSQIMSASAIIVGVIPGGGASIFTFSPASGALSGGAGTYGAFSGTPTSYTGQGAMTNPNSVSFQDGYFFFTELNGTIFASSINSLIMSPLTFVTAQAKADVNLYRGIPFSGLMFFFTSGSCEVWQDAALTAPNFPYSRLVVLDIGLVQPNAIAGWDTGFSELLWVAQDYGVHWMTAGGLQNIKVSEPDLDRLIEAEVRAGNTLEASCYIASGKKFWVLSSPDWSWEFNLQTKKWSERWSLNSSGLYARWRATCSHPAFGFWLMGDTTTGNLGYPDDTNFTEYGATLLFRIESGAAKQFPNQIYVARADFDFVMGVGKTGSPATAQRPYGPLSDPQVAISMSRDGGKNWGNSLQRPLGQQGKSLRSRASVTRMGLSGTMGARFRLDITDANYVSFLGGTMSGDVRNVGS